MIEKITIEITKDGYEIKGLKDTLKAERISQSSISELFSEDDLFEAVNTNEDMFEALSGFNFFDISQALNKIDLCNHEK